MGHEQFGLESWINPPLSDNKKIIRKMFKNNKSRNSTINNGVKNRKINTIKRQLQECKIFLWETGLVGKRAVIICWDFEHLVTLLLIWLKLKTENSFIALKLLFNPNFSNNYDSIQLAPHKIPIYPYSSKMVYWLAISLLLKWYSISMVLFFSFLIMTLKQYCK